jgi:hypothetical protein
MKGRLHEMALMQRASAVEQTLPDPLPWRFFAAYNKPLRQG